MEERLVINGGRTLHGSVEVSGGKNTAVAVIPAALLCDEPCVIEHVPDIEDVHVLQRMMEWLGAKVEFRDHTITVDPRGVNRWDPPDELVSQMRASNYLLGILLSRFHKALVAPPGGCAIGTRPMDQHFKGFRCLNADVSIREKGRINLETDHLRGGEIYLDCPSVGATVNIMLAAVRAEGHTDIIGAAKEPHVVDLANFLNAMGGRVRGAGTDVIRIEGRRYLHGCTYSLLPDQIETGTWMAIAAATNSDFTITNCVPFHMESVTAKLIEMGYSVEEGDDTLRVTNPTGRKPRPVRIKTLPYPGFPTDMQQPFSVLMTVATGTSHIIETIFESRTGHVDYLRRMGASIYQEDNITIIEGVEKLWGTQVAATDLRAGAAMVIAGLMADGETTISNVKYIDRGYDHLTEKLLSLGADICRVRVD